MRENIEVIRETSPKVAEFIEKEYNRQRNNVELIASENYCSETVLAACGSCLSWKYAEGYPTDRTSGNTGRYYVNLQPHSGSQANYAAYKAVTEIAKEVGAYFLVDMAHIAGLVAGGVRICRHSDNDYT